MARRRSGPKNPQGNLNKNPGTAGATEVRQIEGFLKLEHPIYRVWKNRWAANEAALMGGDDVLNNLQPFEWETDLTSIDPLSPYLRRQAQAIYINFPDIFLSAVTGHLMRFAPEPQAGLNMGTLGEVGKSQGIRTQADLVFKHPDGPTQLGMDWNSWWSNTFKMAGATGHRWVYVEAPDQPPSSKQEELDGQAPYLTEYSPLDVSNWTFDDKGNLQFAVVRFWRYDPFRLIQLNTTSSVRPNPYYDYLLLIQRGYKELGPVFQGGGWWKFDPDVIGYDQGNFDDCDGQIPMFPAFYERAKGTQQRPSISRPGITELSQAAIAAMNISSAANFNAWDNGQGLTFLAGVDEEGQALAIGQIARGDRYIGLPPNQDTDATPTVHVKSDRTILSTVFDTRERAIWAAAVQLGIQEAVATTMTRGGGSGGDGPGNSGSAQQATFSADQAPRIVRVAANLETAQNKALLFLELRFGNAKPTANVQWPKKFDLVELTDRIREFFEIQRLAGISSPSLDSTAMLQVARDKGIINEPGQEQTATQEYKTSAKLKVKAQTQQANPAQMSAPQSQHTMNKQKAREAGKKADKTGPKVNTGRPK